MHIVNNGKQPHKGFGSKVIQEWAKKLQKNEWHEICTKEKSPKHAMF